MEQRGWYTVANFNYFLYSKVMINKKTKKPVDKTVLIVEDEKPLLEVIKKKFELNGFSVVTARSVNQALGYLEDIVDISAIWLDHYLLGKKDGFDFVVNIKQEGGKWKHVPIFLVSNTVGSDKIQPYLRLGVNKYYAKSNYRLDKIVENIKEFLNTKGKKV